MTTRRIVIVGAGQAGLQAADSLRASGFAGEVCLIGDESLAPYQRPPLSKAFLSAEATDAQLFMQGPAYFAECSIEFLPGARAIAVDRSNCRVDLADGAAIAYDHLILATGARNRMLACSNGDSASILYLRTLSDAKRLKASLTGAKRITIVGAGFLGLEVATSARAAGLAVQIIEAGPCALGRAVSRPVSEVIRQQHELRGANISFDQSVIAIHDSVGGGHALELRNGRRVTTDLTLVAIGVVPNVELAAAAGLEIHDGIRVDRFLSTEDPAISAIGDCACFPYAPDDGRLVRLESVQNALDQARCVARKIMGTPVAYDQTPLFWSDQAGVRLQIAGVAHAADEAIIRGHVDKVAFSVFRFRNGQLVSVESVNSPGDHVKARKLLRAGISPTPVQVADTTFDLGSALANSKITIAIRRDIFPN